MEGCLPSYLSKSVINLAINFIKHFHSTQISQSNLTELCCIRKEISTSSKVLGPCQILDPVDVYRVLNAPDVLIAIVGITFAEGLCVLKLQVVGLQRYCENSVT